VVDIRIGAMFFHAKWQSFFLVSLRMFFFASLREKFVDDKK